jgi:glycosyltransferase involved in cell wall biosynthesis
MEIDTLKSFETPNEDLYYVSPEYNPAHFRGLAAAGLPEKNFIPLNPIKFFVKGLIRRDTGSIIMALRFLPFLCSLLKSRRVVVVSCLPTSVSMIFLSKFLRKHTVIFYTSYSSWDDTDEVTRLVRNAIRESLAQIVDACIGISDRATISFKDYIGRQIITRTIPHVVEFAKQIGEGLNVSLSPRLDEKIGHASPRVLFVGRLVDEKGILDLEIISRKLDIEITICGSGPLERFVIESPNLKWLGHLDGNEMETVYQQHDVLVLPSKTRRFRNGLVWKELFGLVVVEAALMGLKICASDHPGPVSISKSLPLEIFPEDEFVERFVELYSSGELIQRKVQTVASKEFSFNSVQRQWCEFFEEIAS